MVAVWIAGWGIAADRAVDDQRAGMESGEGQPGVDVANGELRRVWSEDLDFHRGELYVKRGGLA